MPDAPQTPDPKPWVPTSLVTACILVGLIAVGVFTVKRMQRAEAARQRQVAAERREDFIRAVQAGDDGHKVHFFNDPLLPGELVSDPQCVANLKHLSFFMTDVSDPRFGQIRQLVNVRSLHFYDCGDVSAFLKSIAGMPSIESIFFESYSLPESGVPLLGEFPNLKSVRMWHRVDAKYRAALEKAVPNAELVIEQ